MKKVSFLGLVMLLLCFSQINAFSYEVTDATLVQANKDLGWRDAIPGGEESPYNIFGMNIMLTDSRLDLSIITNYPGTYTSPTMSTFAGDLLLDIDLDGVWDYGVAFTEHSLGDTEQTMIGGIYEISSVKTSMDFFSGGDSGLYYGEKWNNPWSGNLENVPVIIGDGSLKGDANLTRSVLGSLPYTYNVLLDLSLLGVEPIDTIGIFYASANCGNDIMATYTPVPEPTTLLLLGSGLAGLVAFRKKAKKQKYRRSVCKGSK